MTVQQSLDNLFSNGLTEILASLEDERRRRVAFVWKWVALVVFLALAASGVVLIKAETFFGVIVAAVLGLIACICLVSRQGSAFAGAFKTRVMPELVHALGPGLEYDGWDYLDVDEFRECGLFMAPDRYHGSDLVEGLVGKTELRFSMVHAEEEYEVTDTETDSDGNTTTTTRTEYRDIFRGILFSADCNKHFSGSTFVCAGGSGFFSRMRKSFVKLESPEFDRAFTVYSADQVEARYLLSPGLMERIMNLREKTGKGLQLSFVGERLYVAVPMSLSAFRPSLWHRIDDLKEVTGYFWLLQLIVGMVDDLNLNLNTRIWSKSA